MVITWLEREILELYYVFKLSHDIFSKYIFLFAYMYKELVIGTLSTFWEKKQATRTKGKCLFYILKLLCSLTFLLEF